MILSCPGENEEDFHDVPFTSLAEFISLERLWTATHRWANFHPRFQGWSSDSLRDGFSGKFPPNLKSLIFYDSHQSPALTDRNIEHILETAILELPCLEHLSMIGGYLHYGASKPVSNEKLVSRETGSTFVYSYESWDGLTLRPSPIIENLVPPLVRDEATYWNGLQYTTGLWTGGVQPKELRYDAVMAELEDAPANSEEIWELHENCLEEYL